MADRVAKEKQNQKLAAKDVWSLILLVLITATLVFIWTNSMEAPAESSEKSQRVMELLTPFLEVFVGKGNVTEFLVRKLAHFCEFGLLGCELSLMLVLRKRQTLQWYVNIAMFAFVVAALDETIQIFADRGSSLADVWIDFAGAATGIVGIYILHAIGRHFIRRKRYKKTVRRMRAMRDTSEASERSKELENAAEDTTQGVQ